jgi:hypothetical protein
MLALNPIYPCNGSEAIGLLNQMEFQFHRDLFLQK